MIYHPTRLVLPFLDREFQMASRFPVSELSTYCKLALIVSPGVVASPSFFIESQYTRQSILVSPDFYGSQHVVLSLRDTSLESYLRRKQAEYVDLGYEYGAYYNTAETLVSDLVIPIRRRGKEIGASIQEQWLNDLYTDKPLSLLHMVNLFESQRLRESVFSALRSVVDVVGQAPFVWESISRTLDQLEPQWRDEEFVRSLRSYLLKLYFDSLCEYSDSIVAFSDFPELCVADHTLKAPTIPITPLRDFLRSAGVLRHLRQISTEEFLGLIDSDECKHFRYRYHELVAILSTNETILASLSRDRMWETKYPVAVNMCRKLLNWAKHEISSIIQSNTETKNRLNLREALGTAPITSFLKNIREKAQLNDSKLAQMVVENIQGDIVLGSKSGGDIITVGNVHDSHSITIGRGPSNVSQDYSTSMSNSSGVKEINSKLRTLYAAIGNADLSVTARFSAQSEIGRAIVALEKGEIALEDIALYVKRAGHPFIRANAIATHGSPLWNAIYEVALVLEDVVTDLNVVGNWFGAQLTV